MNSITFQKDLLGVQDDLLRFAYKLTSDREEANDLLQETSLKALDNEDKYMPDTNFKGWMYTIMRNIFINNYRKLVRDQTFVDQTDNLYHLNLPQESGFQSTESAYDLKEMHRVVNALPREYKIPFSMHVSGFKYREIAEKLASFFYFSKKELTLNRTLRACLSKRELFQMIIPSKIYALCYDISQETELKKETCIENCNHWL